MPLANNPASSTASSGRALVAWKVADEMMSMPTNGESATCMMFLAGVLLAIWFAACGLKE